MWKNANEIFLGQGKYALEILKRFGMLDCISITTPISYNFKLLSDASYELVDATMYHQMIGSLIFLTNTIPYI